MKNDDHNSLSAELSESSWLLNLARALVGTSAAEDLVQEAYLERLKSAETAERPRAFMGTLLRRLAYKSQRTDQRRQVRETEAHRRQCAVLVDAALRGERLAMLWREIEELDAETRSILVLRFVDGLEVQHIGRQLDISPNAARQRMHRALEELRLRLDRRHGGKREDWLRALAPLFLGSPAINATTAAAASSSLAKGVILMGLQKKTLALAALFFLLVTSALVLREFVGAKDGELEPREIATTGRETSRVPRRDETPLVPEIRTEEASQDGTEESAARGPSLIQGRVVDHLRRPVIDAQVQWFGRNGQRLSTRSREGGAFQLFGLLGDSSEFGYKGRLIAHDDRGRSGSQVLNVDEHLRADGTETVICIEQQEDFPLLVRRANGDLASAAEIQVSDSEGLPCFRGRCDDLGRVVIPALPAGIHRFLVWQGQESADLNLDHAIPAKADTELRLQAGRNLRLLIQDEAGQALPGARLRLLRLQPESELMCVDPRAWPKSDEGGEVLLSGLAEVDAFMYLIDLEGYQTKKGLMVEEGDRMLQAVTLQKAPILSWYLQDGEVPAPLEGEVIQVRNQIVGKNGAADAQVKVEIKGNQLFLRGYEIDESYILETSRGEVARVWSTLDFNPERSLSFERARELSVQVLVAQKPGAGLGLQVRQLGGVPLRPTSLTDENGRVQFSGLFGGPCDVFVGSARHMHEEGFRVASVDLSAGSREIRIEIEESLRLSLSLQLEGRPRIPGRYALDIEGAQILNLHEDPQTGIILVDYRPIQPQAQHRLRMEAPGFVIEDIRFAARPNIQLHLDLIPSTRLNAEVILPRDGKTSLTLLRFDERRRDWVSEADGLRGPISDNIMSLAMSDLKPGRYRLSDRSSHSWSGVALVTPGAAEVILRLDLSQIQEIVAQVQVPEGYKVQDARIRSFGHRVESSLSWKLFGLPVDGDGRLKLRVDLGQDVRLVGSHPQLMTTPITEAVSVAANNKEPILELKAGPCIEAEIPVDILASSRVYVFPAGEDQATHFHSLLRSKGKLEIHALAPGHYDFFFDCGPYAPTWLRNQELKSSGLDLGKIDLDEGLSLVIELDIPEGGDIPEFYVSVASLDGPRYVRFKNAFGENPIRVSGLIPGRHEIEIGDVGVPGDQRRIELDINPGENPVIRYP